MRENATTSPKRKRLAFVISVEVPASCDANSVLDDLLSGIDALAATGEAYRYMAQPKGHHRAPANVRGES